MSSAWGCPYQSPLRCEEGEFDLLGVVHISGLAVSFAWDVSRGVRAKCPLCHSVRIFRVIGMFLCLRDKHEGSDMAAFRHNKCALTRILVFLMWRLSRLAV